MIAEELNRPSDPTGSGLSPIGHEALTITIAFLVERIRSLSEEDKQDLFALVNELPHCDAEGVESTVRAMREILEQARGTITPMTLSGGVPDDARGLKKWIDFVSQRIVDARTTAGLTQHQLADKSGLPQSHISRLERGKHSPSRVTLERIAAALEIPVSQLDPSAD
jgi:DNA-binding XRE family transcriptional regulator